MLLLNVDRDWRSRVQSLYTEMLLFVNDSTVSGRYSLFREGKELREKVRRGLSRRSRNSREGRDRSLNEVTLLFERSREVRLFGEELLTASKKVDTPQPFRSTEADSVN